MHLCCECALSKVHARVLPDLHLLPLLLVPFLFSPSLWVCAFKDPFNVILVGFGKRNRISERVHICPLYLELETVQI